MPCGRLSHWKWVTGISPGVKAAGAYGWRPTTLVVPNVKKIRGLNLPGTPWATSACCGITFTFVHKLYVSIRAGFRLILFYSMHCCQGFNWYKRLLYQVGRNAVSQSTHTTLISQYLWEVYTRSIRYGFQMRWQQLQKAYVARTVQIWDSIKFFLYLNENYLLTGNLVEVEQFSIPWCSVRMSGHVLSYLETVTITVVEMDS